MTQWLRFEDSGTPKFGALQDDLITVYDGTMFEKPRVTTETVPLSTVTLLTPTEPTKMVALWNNYYASANKQGLNIPKEPLYIIKPSSSLLPSGGVIRRPSSYSGRIVYEGELGIVIGRRCKEVSVDEAEDYIFGYTCINDVTALELIKKDESFEQWTRAKSFDTFGVFGPVVATGLNPNELIVKTTLNGRERQNYPVSDIIFPPAQLVSLCSQNMTFFPGDVIACGTSIGVLPMKPGATVEVSIDGIGTLSNTFE